MYKINGVALLLQPTTGRWLARQMKGVDGSGHAIYSAIREFEMKWVIETPAQHYQLQDFFDRINNTGTVVVDLPRYKYATYAFYSYTGCLLEEPEAEEYFTEHKNSVVLIVTNIRI